MQSGASSSPYPLLVDALRLLPGTRPVRERYELGEAKYRASLSPNRTADVNGVPVTLAQLEELFLYGERGGPRISQEGARFLLHLFRQGAFDSFGCRKVEGGLDLLVQYSEGLATVLDYTLWRTVRRPGESHAASTPTVQKSTGRAEGFLITTNPRRPNVVAHRLT